MMMNMDEALSMQKTFHANLRKFNRENGASEFGGWNKMRKSVLNSFKQAVLICLYLQRMLNQSQMDPVWMELLYLQHEGFEKWFKFT